jgi:hypothetical protein
MTKIAHAITAAEIVENVEKWLREVHGDARWARYAALERRLASVLAETSPPTSTPSKHALGNARQP